MIGSQRINNRAGIYLRLSNEDLDKNEKEESMSITNQRALLTRYAERNGIRIIDEYVDDGFSGTNFDRPEFQRMLEDLKRNKIDVIMTKDMSRLGRDYINTCYYIEKFFPENNIRYISILDGLDTAIDDGLNDITPFKAVLNDMYSKDISKKIRSIKKTRAEAGLYMGTYAPYGYKKDPENKNHLIIDQEVAPIIRKIFAYGAEGIAPMQIAYKLTAENIPTPSSVIGNKHSRKNEFTRKDWNAHVIRRMLRNELYIGNLVLGRSKKLSYKSKKIVQVEKENWIINKNTHEPIVSQEIFDMAQLHLDSRQVTRERVHNPLLKGLVTCKECGKKLSIMASKDRKGNTILYFRCNTYASSPLSRYCTPHNNNIDKLTEVVINQIKVTCLKYMDEKKLKKVAKEKTISRNKQEENKLKRESLVRQIKNLETKIDKIYDDKLNGIIAQNDFKRMYDGYVQQRIKLGEQLNDLITQKEEIDNRLDLDKIVKDFVSMKKITSTIIAMLVSKIEITQNKEVYIHYRFKELQKSAS